MCTTAGTIARRFLSTKWPLALCRHSMQPKRNPPLPPKLSGSHALQLGRGENTWLCPRRRIRCFSIYYSWFFSVHADLKAKMLSCAQIFKEFLIHRALFVIFILPFILGNKFFFFFINSLLYSAAYSVALYNWNNSNRTKRGNSIQT